MERELATENAVVRWEKDDDGGNILMVECTIDLKDKKARKNVKVWEERCNDRLRWYRENLRSIRTSIASEVRLKHVYITISF